MSHVAACTIVSNNYLAFARVFAESYRQHHPGAPIFVCVVDRPDPVVSYVQQPFEIVFADQLGIPGFANMAFRYDVLELNTAVKPYLLAWLRDHAGLDRVLYFDPDILVLDTLGGIETALAENLAVLTPHLTEPLDNSYLPPERLILMSGVYNLGFLGLRLGPETESFLTWWQDRLFEFCRSDVHNGLFVDQGWMDLAPAYLDRVAVLRDPIYNIAYWNLAQRRPLQIKGRWQLGGHPVGFVHFSGLQADDGGQLSRHQNRIDLAQRPELVPLVEDYRRRLFEAGHASFAARPYAYSTFSGCDVPVPGVARRALQRVDPRGRRWPDPFDIHAADSFFTWLVEPIELAGGALNRTALSLWEERSDLIRSFPDVCGENLEAYVGWLIACREGETAGLHPIFLAGLARGARGRRKPLPGASLPHYDAALTTGDATLLTTLDLRHPGALIDWLNEPLSGAVDARPVITRLALLLFRLRGDVQRAYPDPLGRNQREFAYWFARFAAREHRLHPDLVAPVRASLGLRGRLSLAFHGRRDRALEANGEPAGAFLPQALTAPLGHDLGPHALPEPAPKPSSAGAVGGVAPGINTPAWGVNVGGYFEMETGVGQVARGTLAALAVGGIPTAVLPLDQEPQGRIVAGCYQAPEGAPFPVTLLHSNADETPRALARFPAAVAAASFRIGYWFWELPHFPLAFADRFSYLDEVWAPSRFCLESFRSLSPIPVRHVPPCVPLPRAGTGGRERFGLEPGRFYLFVCFDVLSVPERKNPFAALEALRRLSESSRRPVGMVMKITRASAAPELVSRLREAAGDLRVHFHTGRVEHEEIEALIGACDALLSLHRSEGLGLLPIEALYLGRPVVATAFGGVLDFLDESTGFPVTWQTQRLEQDHGPYRAGSVWAAPDLDHAVERLQEVLAQPEEARRRTERGRRRVQQLYSPAAAAIRFEAELERVYKQICDARAGDVARRPAAEMETDDRPSEARRLAEDG